MQNFCNLISCALEEQVKTDILALEDMVRTGLSQSLASSGMGVGTQKMA